MSDMDRFAEFLRREARAYNEAPRTPAEVMWRGVEAGLENDGVAGGSEAAADRVADDEAVDALGYNEAPRAPREEMWGRIEAAWVARGVGVGAEGRIGPGGGGVVAGLPTGRRGPWRWPARRWPQRRKVAGWVAGLAAAASLVLGLALGRNAGPSQGGEVVGGPQVPAPVAGTGVEPAGAEAGELVQSAGQEAEVLAASVLPLPGAPVEQPEAAVDPQAADLEVADLEVADLQAAAPTDARGRPDMRVTDDSPAARPTLSPSPFSAHRDDETMRYLGRAETLLTAFRIDQRTPVSELDLAMWARNLLVETRMRLDLPVQRTPDEHALLEDLELILLQISRLGTGVPHVEWRLARESMELKGALPRLRAVSSTDGM